MTLDTDIRRQIKGDIYLSKKPANRSDAAKEQELFGYVRQIEKNPVNMKQTRFFFVRK